MVVKINPYLKENLDALKLRVKNKKASMIVIDGFVGEGKTTLGVQCADYIEGKDTNLQEQYAMGGEEFQEKLLISHNKGHKVVIYDEAGDFNSRGALTKFNQQLNRVFETYRAFKIIVILILPSFKSLDGSLLDKGVPRLLLHCNNRSASRGSYFGYSVVKMYYLKNDFKKVPIPSYAYKNQTPNFIGHFKDLSPERSKELEKISIKGKKNIVNENILASKGLINYDEMAKRIGKSVVWLRQKTNEMGIKEKEVYKRKKYFDKSVLDRLVGEC